MLISTLLCGCAAVRLPFYQIPEARDLPFIHKIDVQQGNVVTQEMVGQLRPGMDKKKVQYIMGTPVIQDTFNANRWDYVYTFQTGGGNVESRRVTLVFADDKLDRVEGNVKAAAGKLEVALHQDTTVDVPKDYRKGFIGRIKDTIPFTGDKDAKASSKPAEDKTAAANESAAGVAAKTETKGDAAKSAPTTVAAAGKPADVAVPEDPSVERAKPAPKENPYENIQAAPGEGIVVPPDAPSRHRKKGFLTRIVDSIGIGAHDDDSTRDNRAGPEKPTYHDVSNPNDR